MIDEAICLNGAMIQDTKALRCIPMRKVWVTMDGGMTWRDRWVWPRLVEGFLDWLPWQCPERRTMREITKAWNGHPFD